MFTTCPVCGCFNIVHVGFPPSKHSFFNRCTGSRLSGRPGIGGRSHTIPLPGGWYRPPRDKEMCGAPLTDFCGVVVNPLAPDVFRAATQEPFSVAGLIEMVYDDDQLRSLAQAHNRKRVPSTQVGRGRSLTLKTGLASLHSNLLKALKFAQAALENETDPERRAALLRRIASWL